MVTSAFNSRDENQSQKMDLDEFSPLSYITAEETNIMISR